MSESRQNSGVGDDGHESEEDGDEERGRLSCSSTEQLTCWWFSM